MPATMSTISAEKPSTRTSRSSPSWGIQVTLSSMVSPSSSPGRRMANQSSVAAGATTPSARPRRPSRDPAEITAMPSMA